MSLLLYSGGCNVCRVIAHYLARLDPSLSMLPFRHSWARPYLRDIPEEERYTTWYYIDSGGRRWPGNDGGGIQMLKRYRPTRWIACAAEFCGLTCVFNALDRFVKNSRPWIAKVLFGLLKHPDRQQTIRWNEEV